VTNTRNDLLHRILNFYKKKLSFACQGYQLLLLFSILAIDYQIFKIKN